MSIFQAGVPRSGNLWIYRMIQNMYRVREIQTKSLARDFRENIAKIGYLEPNKTYAHDVLSIKPEGSFWEPTHQSYVQIHDFDQYLASCTHIWTHQPYCEEHSELYPKFDKIINIVRDPRDVLISNSKYLFTERTKGFRPREDEEEDSQKYIEKGHFKRVHGWIRHVGSYLKHYNELDMHFVFYERFLANFDEEFEKLRIFLGFDLTQDQILQVKEAVSFKTMHQEKPEHVRKGKSGQWEDSLTEAQIQNIKAVGSPFLQYLGYGVEQKLETLPDLPKTEDIDSELIDSMIKNSGEERSKLVRNRSKSSTNE